MPYEALLHPKHLHRATTLHRPMLLAALLAGIFGLVGVALRQLQGNQLARQALVGVLAALGHHLDADAAGHMRGMHG